MKRKSLWLVLLFTVMAVCLGIFAGCKKKPDNEVTLTLPEEISIVEGESKMVTATTNSSKALEWSLEDNGVAEIVLKAGKMCSVKGLVPGTANLTASVDGVTATTRIVVTSKADQERVEIKYNGNVVTEKLSLEQDKTLQLTAEGTKGAVVTSWKSSDNGTATVDENGLVTAKFPGTATITAAVNSSLYAEITVEVTAKAGSKVYTLKYGEEGGTNVFNEETTAFDGAEELVENEFYYWASRTGWGQHVTVEHANYQDGVVRIKYYSDWDPGYWYGFQVFYKNSEHEVGATYKLTCKIKINSLSKGPQDAQEPLDSCNVTLNDNVINLKKGVNEIEVFYVYNAPLHNSGTSSFDLAMGIPGAGNGEFAQNIDFEIYDVEWTKATIKKLEAPSFTLNGDIINITDDKNTEGVGGYRLTFFQGGVAKGTVAVENGKKVDTSTLEKGTYTVKLQAVGKSAGYTDSDFSQSEGEITVTEGPSYELAMTGSAGAVSVPGVWTYHASSWVGVTEKTFKDGVLTFTFDNNAGNWDDTQLYYKSPENVAGKTYKMTFDLELSEGANGRVTICGNEVMLESGKHTYEVTYTEGAANASFAMILALPGQANQQEIQSGTIKISNLSFKEVEGGLPVVPGNLPNGDENTAVGNPGKWYEWHVQDVSWNCGGVVTMENAALAEDGSINIKWNAKNNDIYWFGVQLFYKDAAIADGEQYKLTLNINSSFAGKITVSGTVVELKVGDNAVTVTATQAAGKATVSLQVSAENETLNNSGELTLSNVKIEAVGGGDTPVPPQPVEPQPAGPLPNGGEEDAVKKPGYWYEWHVQDASWNCGGVVTMENAAIAEDGSVNIKWNAKDNNIYWFGVQLFYKDAAIADGAQYKVTLNINSAFAGNITVSGTPVELKVGDNAVTVTATQQAGKATVSIQVGVENPASLNNSGELTLSNVKVEAVGGDTPVPPQPVEATWTTTGVKLQEKDGKLYYVISGTYANMTQAEMQAKTLHFDLQKNVFVMTGSWDGDWSRFCKEGNTFVVNADNTWTYSADISELGEYAYTSHFSETLTGENEAEDFKLQNGVDTTTVIYNNKSYTLVSVFGSTDAMQYWGCVGLSVASASELVCTTTSAKLEVKDGTPCLVIGGTYANGTPEQLKFYFDLQNNDTIMGGGWDYYLKNAGTIAAENGTFTYTVDLSALNRKGAYTTHFSAKLASNNEAGDFKLASGVDTTAIKVGELQYRLANYPNSSVDKEFWGCVGLYVEDATATPDPTPVDPVTPPMGEVKAITLEFKEIYGGNMYFHFVLSEDVAFDDVNVDGAKATWKEYTADSKTFKVQVGEITVSKTYIFDFIKDGKVVATATYEYVA